MNLPEHVIEIAKESHNKHKDDCQAAARAALRRIKKLPDYKEIAEALILEAVKVVIYDVRAVNIVQSKRSEFVSIKAKTQFGLGKGAETVLRAVEQYRNLFDTPAGGKTLGQLYGRELCGLAESERARGDGHYRNANLYDALKKLVPDDKQVAKTVSHTQLKALFRRIYDVPKKAA